MRDRCSRQQFDRRHLLAHLGQPPIQVHQLLTTDGEKPWRHRDEEFDERSVTREALLEKWNAGWGVLLQTLETLADDQVHARVTIRGQTMSVHEALTRSLAHLSSHVGQIVYIAKAQCGASFTSLSIPRGASDTFRPKE